MWIGDQPTLISTEYHMSVEGSTLGMYVQMEEDFEQNQIHSMLRTIN